MAQIAVLVGSISANSINKKMARALGAAAPERVEFVEVSTDPPLCNYDLDGDCVLWVPHVPLRSARGENRPNRL